MKSFTVMWPFQRDVVATLERLGCPKRIPWSLIESHEDQALANHGQTLEELNRRGGLDPCELVGVLCGHDVRAVLKMDREKAVLVLKRLLALHNVRSDR